MFKPTDKGWKSYFSWDFDSNEVARLYETTSGQLELKISSDEIVIPSHMIRELILALNSYAGERLPNMRAEGSLYAPGSK